MESLSLSTKVWMLLVSGEGIPSYVKLYREDSPPSVEQLKADLLSFGCEDYPDYRVFCEEKASKIANDIHNYEGDWDSVTLTLETIHRNQL